MHKKSIARNKSILILALVILCISFLTGCATITRGAVPFQDVSVDSDPQGANVVANSGHEGVTPCVLKLEKNRIHVLEIVKKGYETAYVTIRKAVDDSSACNLIAGGVIGIGLDDASGARYKLVPEKINVKLTKTTGS